MNAGYVYSPRAGAPGGAYAIRPYTGTIIRAIGPPRGTVIRAIGPPRVSPWAMIRRPYRAHGYPGRPDGPT